MGRHKKDQNYNLVGPSKHLQRVREQIATAAELGRNVIIQGPSGTGKELIAKAIHDHGARRGKPYVVFSCPRGTDNLLDDMLFGHEKGAFTGAHNKTIGYLERANGGTLFLDEVADAPLATQAKLLRVIQEGSFERVGGSETVKVDVRFIAATNKNIENEIEESEFRADLFSRLNQYRIRTKSLKNRSSDTICIINNLLQKRLKNVPSEKDNKKMKTGDITKIKFLVYHLDLPGNVRDLQNYAFSDLQHVVREFKTRLKRIDREISRKKSAKKLLTRYNKMRTALRLVDGDLLPEEEELIRAKITTANKKLKEIKPQEVCITWCVKAFEIVRLIQKTDMSQKDISEIIKTRPQDITPKGFKNRFGIPHPKDMRYVMNFPIDALKVLKRV